MKQTPLYQAHVDAGARMVEFAGYEMPVQYPMGVKKEHLWVRENAGLFDVSHMGQVILSGENVKAELESILPVDVQGLAENTQRYGFFTNANGGIQDDLMFANWGDRIFMVVNAACKDQDIPYMQAKLATSKVEPITDRALLALQGPKAREVAGRMLPELATMTFMQTAVVEWNGCELWVSCSGYTGEDGYEISVPADQAEAFAASLLAQEEVEWIGLGARDSLRLEAGLCLYGHDLDETTSPVEGGLTWAIQKVRRQGGEREGGFVGADVILGQFAEGVSRKRVGFVVDGKAPVREGVEIVTADGEVVGNVTSGGFAPSLERPIVMGYVQSAYLDTALFASLRGKLIPLESAKLPFVPARFYRG